MSLRSLLPLAVIAIASTAQADPYVPAPAASIPGYAATVLPCKIVRPNDDDARMPFTEVRCKNGELDKKGLRELAIMRNTIYARYGWDGFRKEWLRDHFRAQPWFKPNPAFKYKLASDADRKNAHLIAAREQAFTEGQLTSMEQALRKKGDAALTADDRIELGLISRALGSFATDGEIAEKVAAGGSNLDQLLKVEGLRKLSMRDLRLLRNTIYARRGRAFKSQVLRDHFGNMSWYKVDVAYSDARLSKTDQRNVSLIKSVENEFGGPLNDDDWLVDPAVDGA